MNKLFNEGFSFLLMEQGSCFDDFSKKKGEAKPVKIPHDWAVSEFELFYKDGVGFYNKTISFDRKNSEFGEKGHAFIRFDGVYMDSSVYLNGKKIFEWKYGYTSFVIELTDYLVDGDNELTVMVNYQNPNSRWYSGAGIYRNVWWIETDETYIPDGGVYVYNKPLSEEDYNKGASVTAQVTVQGATDGKKLQVVPTLYDEESVKEISDVTSNWDVEGSKLTLSFVVNDIELWSPDSPKLYGLELKLIDSNDNNEICSEKLDLGFRYITWSSTDGFILNGETLKLNGVCEHHDFGSLGSAFYPEALERKVDKLKEMGVNAIRTSHNPVSREFYEVCDRRGILVDSEAFDMWEMPKTNYDYARFFPEWYKTDVERWVKDARNHPCIIMWSIGNEIPDTHAGPRGREVANNLMSAVLEFDPEKNAKVTFGSNYMPWENTQIVANDLKLVGYNYAESYYPEHHEAHPDWIIYGSETSSIVYSRGVYHFPMSAGILSDDDLQCSSLGNSTTSWGAASIETCIGDDAKMKYSLGQFLWTGFDYLGEPTPYWTKNSYFGQLDTAGFPKDPYYMWKSAWTDINKECVLHVFPYWKFNIGQRIDVRVTSNAYAVELFINGESQGKKELGDGIVADYSVDYVPGELLAVAYDEAGNEINRQARYSFGNTDHIEVEEKQYGKLFFYEMQAVDSDGHPVEDACDYINVDVSEGILLALDNGDSTDYESYQASGRKAFRGKLLAIVEKTGDGKPKLNVSIDKDNIPVREVVLEAEGEATGPIVITAEKPVVRIIAKVLPENAVNKKVDFRLSDVFGNNTNLAQMEVIDTPDGKVVEIKGLGDGEIVLRATCNDGQDFARVISQLEIKAEGLGSLYTNPYEFVPGSIYSRSLGTLNNGNERGVSTGRDGETTIIFDEVDFGSAGTRSLEIPIFALTDDVYDIGIWLGVPGEEGAELICDGKYQKPSIWNTYQEETFVLNKKLTGVQTISFKTNAKIHFKGFTCTELNPVFEEMHAGYAPQIYGDQYEVVDTKVENIGNNVTIGFGKQNFEDGVSKITICGKARNGVNTLHIRLHRGASVVKEVVEVPPTDNYSEQTFEINGFEGEGELSVIFMPGSDFDLAWIKFS